MDLVYAFLALLRAGFTLSLEPTTYGDVRISATAYGEDLAAAIEAAIEFAARDGLEPTATPDRDGTHWWSMKAAAGP
ncbi:MAG: hypothetical protein KatS3mg051_1845 [Anaerolineae bacterium]|nr:MAG: hypothetical protein KatS3mg051_1845 [Anaerolineae bacterium]